MAQFFVKPPYQLEVNGAHPLATGLRLCVHYNDLPGTSEDVVSRRHATNTDTTTVIRQHGRAIKFSGGASSISSYGQYQPIQGNGACTVMVLADPVSQAATEAIFAQRNGSFEQIDLIFNYNAGVSAGSLGVFQSALSTGVYNQSAAASAIIGGYHWYGFTSGGCVAAGGAVTRLYRDGVLLATGANTATGNSPVSISQFTSVGGLVGTGGFQYGQSVAAVFVWTRELTEDEVQGFVADPWAVLTRNDLSDWWFLQAGAAAADGAFASSGAGAASFIGASLSGSAFSTAGVGAVSFLGGSLSNAQFGVSGAASVTFQSSGAASAAYGIGGTASVSFSGAAIASGAISSSGVAATSFSASALYSASFASSGIGAVSFVSSTGGVFNGTFASNGTAAFNAVGQSVASGSYASGASASVGFVSQSLFSTTFSINGVGAISGVSATAGSIYAITGTGTLSAIGRSLADSSFSSNGLSNVSWASPFTGAGSVLDGKRKLFVYSERRVLRAWLK